MNLTYQRAVAGAAFAMLAPAACAWQTSNDADAVPETARVEVKGAAYNARRDDTASKTVMSHEEIAKYGSATVFEVLRRAPGVTVVGESIRMRGLGDGYTQVLVNGESPPPGFSLSALTPDQIERIEIMRAASAEYSMQAIAGTVNIVLAKAVSKPQRDLRLNGAYSGQQREAGLGATLADVTGRLSYGLNGSASHNATNTDEQVSDRLTAPDGRVVQQRDTRNLKANRSTEAMLQPRLTWKLDDDGQFNITGTLQGQRLDGSLTGRAINRVGAFGNPDYLAHDGVFTARVLFAGGDANWVTPLAGGKLDAKFGAYSGHLDNQFSTLSVTQDRAAILRRDSDARQRFATYTSSGKFTRTLFAQHGLTTGWEANREQESNDTLRVEGLAGGEAARIAEQFDTGVTKLAAFVQDEWSITPAWSMYVGMRWEGIGTDSTGTGIDAARSRYHVVTPVAQTLYKLPGKAGRQVRLALTRTFRAPASSQLSARRTLSDQNSRFNPDNRGNPDLRPELARGIDATYEQFWSDDAMFSLSASSRHLDDLLVRSRLFVDGAGRWVTMPANEGRARVQTLEAELKLPLKALSKSAPAVDVRLNLNRNWSRVDTLPGPDNRLSEQIPLTATFGADYKHAAVGAGMNLAFRRGGLTRVSVEQYRQQYANRQFDAYLLTVLRAGVTLRLSGSTLLGRSTPQVTLYRDATGASLNSVAPVESARIKVDVEMKF